MSVDYVVIMSVVVLRKIMPVGEKWCAASLSLFYLLLRSM